jgi:hypothetical protein
MRLGDQVSGSSMIAPATCTDHDQDDATDEVVVVRLPMDAPRRARLVRLLSIMMDTAPAAGEGPDHG